MRLSEVDIQEDIEFALIQMKAETLNKINEALRGSKRAATAAASSAATKSPKPRLRALPFAVRCKDCEEAREIAAAARAHDPGRGGASSLFYELQG